MAFEVDPRLLLDKLAFGPSPSSLHEVAKIGVEAWLAQQLKPPAEDDCTGRIASTRWHLKYVSKMPAAEVDEDRALDVIAEPIERHWTTLDKETPYQERLFLRTAVAAATLIRAVHSRWQLREMLVDFWHNHFNVNAAGDGAVAAALPAYDRDVIRRHALGNFREMLEDVATSAAMQVYLNNRSSRGGAANENYARELFELHTLGRPAYLNALYNKWRQVPGATDGRPQGYIDQDVYEAARAFTGWSIEDGAGIGMGRRLPTTGKFTYVETWHDNYQKRVLAAEFDPYQSPLADGRRVLDLVADHPATARYLCGKLFCRLVADTPDEFDYRRGRQSLEGDAPGTRSDRAHHRGDREVRRVPSLGRRQGEAAARTLRVLRPGRRDRRRVDAGAAGRTRRQRPAAVRLGATDRSSRRERLLAQLQHDAAALVVASGPGGRRLESWRVRGGLDGR